METVIKKEDFKVIHEIRFNNLTDIYNYLKKDPEINKKIFRDPSSMSKNMEFYGEPLENAIEYLVKGYSRGFENFIKINNELKKIGEYNEGATKTVRSIHGGRPLAPLVASGVKDCMISNVVNTDARVINLYFQLSYSHQNTTEQIINRGLATLYIIQSLESKGYLINFKAFELSYVEDEILNININLKKPGDLFLNIQKCYFPMVAKEFLRRILFRIAESTAVTEYAWGQGYGSSFDSYEIKNFFKTKPSDLVISSATNMGLYGENIYEDTIKLIKKLNLDSEFDMNRLRKKL